MSYGLEVRNAAGVERLGTGSYIHRLMATGTSTSAGFELEVFVPFTGMTASDEWFVITGAAFPARPGSGGFYVRNLKGLGAQTFAYSVYRR